MNQETPVRWDDGLEGPAKQIAELDHTPIRVLAGPGTGKTFALKRRVARLLQKGAKANRILVCTFTRMAAQDLENELISLGTTGVEDVCSGTLHAFCFRLLGETEVFEFTGRTPRPLLKFEERFLLEDLNRKSFGGIKARKHRLRAFDAAWARLQSEKPGWPTDSIDQVFQQDLEGWLRFHEAMLIGELIPESLNYLRENPESPYCPKFEHVLIDEYQDLNRAEQTLLDLLAEGGQLVVVGDEDQSIYSFKFAHPEGIANFHESHPKTFDIELKECRRCPKLVVSLANELISYNRSRALRTLKPRSANPDGEVIVLQWQNIQNEARGIARIIRSRITKKEVEPGQVLVLAPRRHLGYAVRDALNDVDISSHSFFQEEELDTLDARKAFTLLTLLANPDDRVALRCWCGFNSSNLLRGGWKRLRDHCSDSGESPRATLGRLASGEISIPYTAPLVKRFQELQRHLRELENLMGQALVDMLFPEDQDWAKSLRSLASTIEENEFDAKVLHENLRVQITQPELPTDVDYVRVMSLHKSKGLTADFVVVVGCIEGLVPRLSIATDTQNEMIVSLEEQRRLFYVAITRTRQSLVLSSQVQLPQSLASRMGMDVRNPNRRYFQTSSSRFLRELGPSRPRTIRGTDFLEELVL